MKNTKNTKGFYKPEIIEKFSAALEDAKQIKNLRVSISTDNTKMGPVASVSTLPFLTCPARCSGTCGVYCYAAKLANLRRNVRESYARNTALAIRDLPEFMHQVDDAVKGFRFFRWHVSGDILNDVYFSYMVRIAANSPHTEFLVFTKRFEIVNEYVAENGESIPAAIPTNMHILFSGGPGVDMINPYGFPETTVIINDSDFDDTKMKYCGGDCFNCACRGLGCWQAKTGDTIAFKKH